MIDILYAVPTYMCNLNCKHCIISQQYMHERHDQFIEKLKNSDAKRIILFGGEPLILDIVYLSKIIETGKINAISTNLLLLSKMHLDLFVKHNVSIATSWNPKRFDLTQYKLWLNNVKISLENKIHVTVLITLTEDLFESNVVEVLDDLNNISNEYFDGVKFEPFVLSTTKLIEKSDIWLTTLIDKWHYNFKNITFEDYKIGNLNFCNKIYTLNPDCNIMHSCPQHEKDNFIDNCLKCKYNKVCRPCKKLKVCTFFKNFYLKVQQLCR